MPGPPTWQRELTTARACRSSSSPTCCWRAACRPSTPCLETSAERCVPPAASQCASSDFQMYDYQRDFRRGESEVRGVLGTRALIEQTVRSMLLEQERGVQLRSAAPVAGLLFEGGGGSKQLTGVKLKGGEVLATDLVVDASGRSSQTADWMAAAGLQPPPKLMVDAKLGYATRFYERPADYSGPPAALVGGRPMFTRGAVLIPVEGNSWQLILGDYAGDHRPTDEEGFAAFMRSLKSPCVAQMLQGAKPLSAISRYLGTRNLGGATTRWICLRGWW